MSLEVSSSNVVCSKCGTSYGRRKGNFSVNYGILYKGVGYLTVCKSCVDNMYNEYLSLCNNPKLAVRQVCRKLDIYWSDKLFDGVEKKSTAQTVMTTYLSKLTTNTYLGKSYDDTLKEEGVLWSFDKDIVNNNVLQSTKDDDTEVSEEIIMLWGSGYTPSMYAELENRRKYWMSVLPDDTDLDAGTEALIRQICALELDINRDRAAGKSVEKSLNTYNTLIGSAGLKPALKNKDGYDTDASIEKTPMGVWAQIYETKRPIPEVDPELRDVDGIVKYISTWFLGHLCKMLGIKNSYCKLYEQEIEKMRIEHPEFDDEDDDEALFNNIFCSDNDGDV